MAVFFGHGFNVVVEATEFLGEERQVVAELGLEIRGVLYLSAHSLSFGAEPA